MRQIWNDNPKNHKFSAYLPFPSNYQFPRCRSRKSVARRPYLSNWIERLTLEHQGCSSDCPLTATRTLQKSPSNPLKLSERLVFLPNWRIRLAIINKVIISVCQRRTANCLGTIETFKKSEDTKKAVFCQLGLN